MIKKEKMCFTFAMDGKIVVLFYYLRERGKN